MYATHKRKKALASCAFLFLFMSALVIFAALSTLQFAHATAYPISVYRYDNPNSLTNPTNPTQTVSISDIQTLSSAYITGWGGFYQTNKGSTAYAQYTGLPLSYLCSLIGINSNYEVNVTGNAGSAVWSYGFVMTNTADQTTYGQTGTAYSPPQSDVNMILAMSGGTLSSSNGDFPRLLSVNQTGNLPLAINGGGVKGITTIKVIYLGSGSTIGPNLPSSLSVGYSPSSVDETSGQTATISGTLTVAATGVSGETITLYRSDSVLGWVQIGQATTGVGGAYSFDWTPSSIPTGYYQIEASFAGDSSNNYAAATAQTSSPGLTSRDSTAHQNTASVSSRLQLASQVSSSL